MPDVSSLGVSGPWTVAFAEVDRGMFVPEFFLPNPDRPGWHRIASPTVEWRAGVDGMDALITQLDGGRCAGSDAHGSVTSSSSAPPLMVAMLEALDVENGHRVLEIGTGSGYNAALLAHRVGDGNVTSVDVDPDLVRLARRRLDQAGFRPHLETADAVQGAPHHAPYDRIIATVAVPRVPEAWRCQLVPGGTIVAPLDRFGAGGLVVRYVETDGALEGQVLGTVGYFMPLRSNAFDPAGYIDDPRDAAARVTLVSVEDVARPGGAEPLIALRTGGFSRVDFTPSETLVPETWLVRPDGSWACLTQEDDTTSVRQGGPTLIWDGVEDAHRLWTALGRPGREAVTIRQTTDQVTVFVQTPCGRVEF